MKKIVFVAPYFMPATLRFVNAVAQVPGIQLGLISSDPPERLPGELRQLVGDHQRVANWMDAGQLAVAAKHLHTRMGGIDRMFGALEELQVPIARVREFLGIPGMGTEAATNFREKSRMKNIFTQNNLPCARHCLATGADQARAFARATGFPLVVKPPAGAGARDTFQVENGAMLEDYLAAAAPSPANPTLLEEFIRGDEYSFEAVTIDGEVVWHSSTRYFPNPLQVLENPWIQWCVLLPREVDSPKYDDIRTVNRRALRALGMGTGISHMEWFRRGDGSLAVSEVAARPPGAQIMTLMSYANDKDFYRAWAELVVYNHFEIPQRKYAAGAAFLRGQGSGRIAARCGQRVLVCVPRELVVVGCHGFMGTREQLIGR